MTAGPIDWGLSAERPCNGSTESGVCPPALGRCSAAPGRTSEPHTQDRLAAPGPGGMSAGLAGLREPIAVILLRTSFTDLLPVGRLLIPAGPSPLAGHRSPGQADTAVVGGRPDAALRPCTKPIQSRNQGAEMSWCWCGHRPWHHWHGPWHHGGYGYGPPPPGPYGPGYGPWRRGRPGRGWQPDEEDLAEHLQALEDEVRQAREELERLRQSRRPNEG
jgi:hypothetical protein